MRNKKQRQKNFQQVFFLFFFLMGFSSVCAQQYTGMSGLIHVPSADMDEVGVARIGAHLQHSEAYYRMNSYKVANHCLY